MIYPLDSSADYKVILTYLGLFTEDESDGTVIINITNTENNRSRIQQFHEIAIAIGGIIGTNNNGKRWYEIMPKEAIGIELTH